LDFANFGFFTVPHLPADLKSIYRTVWEISQKSIIDMSADRGAYIDQSQSLNIHLQSPTFAQLTSMHFHGWRKGLKTGMYYLRTRAAVGAIQFTVSADIQAQAKAQQKTGVSPVPVAAAAVAPVAAIAEVVPVKASPLSPVNNAPKVNGVAEITAGVGKMSTSLVGAGADVTPILKAKEAPKVESKGEDEDITFEEATRRRKERELEAAKLQCSIDNKEACLMCSG
jgi:ribonucleoside-diphosphate reductase subunit M1